MATSDLGPKPQQNEQPRGCKDDLCVFPLRTAVIITKQLVPLGQLPEPGFCTMSPLALPLCGNLMRSSDWALGECCPLLDGGCTCASDLEEEAALGIWNAVRKAHPLGKRRTVTRVMNFGAYLSSTTTTTSSLRISQWTDFTSAQHNLFQAPRLGMCLLVTLECSVC